MTSERASRRGSIVAIKALMVDVDGVLIDGRPEDGRPWQTSIETDLGVNAEALREIFVAHYWDDIITGRADLTDHLTVTLREVAPHLSPAQFLAYWFERDSYLVAAFLPELSRIRSAGIRVYLATNQEHLRAAWLMEKLGLAAHVDGIFYSARIGVKKPESQFFARVQAAVSLSADEILFIDDNRQNIDAAVQAGWRAHHWTNQSSPDILRSLCP
jgi:putative hydrolase of the HAD superfamily